jgi:hypothetical protein
MQGFIMLEESLFVVFFRKMDIKKKILFLNIPQNVQVS